MPRKITFEDNFEAEDMLDKVTTIKQETWGSVLDRYSAHNKEAPTTTTNPKITRSTAPTHEYRPKFPPRPKFEVKTPTITAILKREQTRKTHCNHFLNTLPKEEQWDEDIKQFQANQHAKSTEIPPRG